MKHASFAPALLLLLLLLGGALTRPPTVAAQVSPADSAAVLLQAAQAFEADERWEVAEALYRFIVERFGTTPAAMEARSRLTITQREGVVGSGRVELQVWSTLYGLWLGVAVPGAFGAEDSEPYGLGLLLGGPVGFLGGRALAKRLTLTEGQARAITLGGTWGTWQGLGLRAMLDIGEKEVCNTDFSGEEFCYEEGDTSQESFAAMILGGLAGIAAGAAISRRPISPGVATTVNLGSLWGTWFGVATGVLMDQEEDGLLAMTLLGGNAGLLSMAVMAPRWKVTRNRARLVSIAGVIGGLGGAGIDLLTQPESEKVAIGIPLVTSLIGLGVGIASTRDDDAGVASAAGDWDGSLVRLQDGQWSVGAPVPVPVMMERDGPSGVERRPGLGFTLFRAAF